MRYFILSAACIAGIACAPAQADEPAAAKEPTRIEIDQSTKTFTFIIDNEPIAQLDKMGLRVVNNVSYGGTLIDTGSDFIQSEIKNNTAGAADD